MSKDKQNSQTVKSGKMKRKEFEQELEKLQVELVKMQQWVVHEGLRVVIVFEGRDAAGKGGTIKRIVDRVSPRVFRALSLTLFGLEAQRELPPRRKFAKR